MFSGEKFHELSANAEDSLGSEACAPQLLGGWRLTVDLSAEPNPLCSQSCVM